MSQDNLDIVAQVYRAFEENDFTAIERLFHPEIEITQTAELPWGGTHIGHAGAVAFFTALLTHLDSKHVPEQTFAAGDDVVVHIGRAVGNTRASGNAFDLQEVHTLHLSDGKVVAYHAYIDTPGMLTALNPAN